ncbi:MAG: valine--tRNA ligase [Alphaproteobacteria bacterium]|nr:valine--tRNA ligase [Alphaproteobacteria bacterium]
MSIEKTYDPSAVETRLYERWEKSGAFACDVHSKKEPYCIMLPPPNVTGSLHMGHALINTLQDILIRFQRMKGKDVLWQLGTDHAGISTQLVVERQLAAQGLDRREMGREAFLKRVWAWKEESGGTITKQLRRLGASGDWSRECFTMDEGLSRAVTREFVTLYNEGLIYKDKRLVNWDPKMLTAVSDLEVESKEVKGHLWYFNYPIEGSDEWITIATTRPETMLGDTAVAVHPENEKLKHLIGKQVKLPLVGRLIPIIGDDYADPEKGTGAVKITPAHDFNDFEVGKRHNLPMINIFDQHAKLNEEAPQKYRGLDRFVARKKIVEDMEALGLLDKIEDHIHAVPHDEKTKTVVIEPFLSEQWYCDVRGMADQAVKAVREGKTQFVPKQWENTFFAWMEDIRPWCISRQLWWGHQIPAWYGSDGKVFVAESDEEADTQAEKHYGKKTALTRDEDVFDTWFSSALWPFSTLGWPDKTPELARYYPTDVLMTGFDIIFFWVARMMMMGLHFVGDVPFRKVFISALVRDEKGQKMSKTRGNVIDPLDVIEKYGCDALRFTLANLSTPGRDIKLSASRIEGNRNFVTKLWNAARFCQMNGCEWIEGFDPYKVMGDPNAQTTNKWIIHSLRHEWSLITSCLEDFRFDLASSRMYGFVWNIFCDWYLELSKPILSGDDEKAKRETQETVAWVLGQIFHLLHPVMPFVTEELWGKFTGSTDMLMTRAWPDYSNDVKDFEAVDEIEWLISLVNDIRTVRAELNVPAGAQIPLQVKGASDETKARFERHAAIIARLARLSGVTHVDAVAKGSAQSVLGEATLILPLAEIIDLDSERARLKKEGEKIAAEIKKLDAKLGNKDFIDRAPPEIVEEQRERRAEAEAILARLEAAQKNLAG